MKMPIKTSAITLSSAIIFSLLTLWLIDSWIKYPLFFFEIATIILLFAILTDCDLKISVKSQIITRNMSFSLFLDLIFIFSSITLLIVNAIQTSLGIVQVVLSLLCTSLLSGFALLNIFGFRQHFSYLETLVLSSISSYALTAFVTLAFIPVQENMRIPLILSAFILLGFASVIKNAKTKSHSTKRSFTKGIDALAIILALLFYALSFCFIYPGFALLSGTDLSRHYAHSIVLWRTPEIYIGSANLLAHLHESAFISLANPSLISAQTALATLNLMLPLAFYIMAKKHLEKVDARLPSLATLFWTLFTNSFGGYAWIYFANLKLSSAGQTQLQLLSSTAQKTYNGTVYGIFGLWYVPATISFVFLMALIFLLGSKELSKTKYFGLLSVLTASLYLTHVTEAVVFALFLAVYGFISKNDNYRTNDAICSTIIGLIIVIAVYYALSQLTPRFIVNASLLMSIIGPLTASALSLIFRRCIRPKLPSIQKTFRVNRTFLVKTLVSALFVAYVVAILSWISLVGSFHTWQVDTIGLVPWFMYPIMLGVNGLLAIIALYYLAENRTPYKVFAFFIAFMIFAFTAGRTVSTINLYFFDAGHWEKRFIWFIKISLAMLAPLPVIYVIDKIRNIEDLKVNTQRVLCLFLIGIIVLYGISTTFLNLEYWTEIANNTANHPSPTEMDAINAFKRILDNDPRTWLATVTARSSAVATFAAPTDMLDLKQLLYTAYGHEMAFIQLYRHPAYGHPYIYLHNRDQEQLGPFSDRFFANYLSMLPMVFGNSEVKIYNASKPSPPQPNSDTVLILPLDRGLCSEETFYPVYSMLSQGFYNYTVAYDLDEKIFNAKIIILAYDPPSEKIKTSVYQDSFNQTISSWAVVKGSWQMIYGGLFGGEVGKYGEGIILSQVSAQNFTAFFKAKPLSGNMTVANYVSLVYSWVDQKNYRIAEIMFSQDGYIYVHFRIIINGVEQAIPIWPGTKTSLKWDFGNEYNITVTVNGTLNQISINNKPYLSIELENIPGRIGLRYFRFYQITFDDFTINYTIKLNLRATEDYTNFLQLGGKILILNTNGYNFFAHNLLTSTNNTLNAEKIEGSSTTINLPKQILMQKLTLKDSTASILSSYVGHDGETPYIIRQNYGEGELFYVNIYPLSDAIRKTENPSTFYPVLGKLLDDLNLAKLDENFLLTTDGYVKAINLSGNSKVETSSLLFPTDLVLRQLDINTTNELITLYNVTDIQIKSNSNLIIEAEHFTIENGQGFYAILKLNSTIIVKPSKGLIEIKATTEKDKIQITGIEKLSMTPKGSVNMLARTPEMSTNQVTFIEFYPSISLQWTTRTYGQNLRVTGLTSFQIMLSDSYTILKSVKLGHSFARDPPITMFDELSTIPTAIFWTLSLLPVFLGAALIYTSKRTQQVMNEKL